VAAGAGWSITTPLGYTRAHRFMGAVEAMPLPFAPLSRTISLIARRGTIGPMPEQIAGRLRPLLAALVVEPSVDTLPWLRDMLRVLPGSG